MVLQSRRHKLLDFVGERNVTTRSEPAYVRAVLVLDAEEHPQASTQNFREGDEKRDEGGMLDIVGVDGVKDPVEAENWVDDEGNIVQPNLLICKSVSKKAVRSARGVQQAPVHYQIPGSAVQGVDGCAEEEQCLKFGGLIKAEER